MQKFFKEPSKLIQFYNRFNFINLKRKGTVQSLRPSWDGISAPSAEVVSYYYRNSSYTFVHYRLSNNPIYLCY